ncbi:fMet-Leu-Phe receptor-like [Notechis scutatus]|uniref:fMet-Leu-Phe receptor-like n=1 Tax=Notechis scutatus TaxID=8663 RepID=A0A6J1VIB4_9SAUR|nr:fMet-Leu-Phe receptor-like [Notechis scutatus]
MRFTVPERYSESSEPLYIYWFKNVHKRYYLKWINIWVLGVLMISNDSRQRPDPTNFKLIGDINNGNCSFSIDNAQLENTGRYYMRIDKGEAYRHTFLPSLNPQIVVTDMKKPVIWKPSSIIWGETINFSCVASNCCLKPKPQIIWSSKSSDWNISKWGKQISDGTWTYGANVSFVPILANEGLTLTYSPQIMAIHICKYDDNSTTTVCSCAFHSWPPPDIQWYMNHQHLTKEKISGDAAMNVSYCLSNVTAVEEVMRHIAIVTNVIILVLGISGNGLVMWIIVTRKKHKTFTSICYFNLAVADFLFSMGRIPALVQEIMYQQWPFGLALCKVHSFVRYLTTFTSVFVLTVISLYRCLMVVKPVWARNHQSPRFQTLMCIGAWTLALFFSLPYLVVRTIEVRNGASCCIYHKSLKTSTELPLRMSRFFGGFLLPFTIISTAYSILLCKLRERRWKGCHRTISLVAAIVALFFICWLPHHVFVLLNTIWTKNALWGIALKVSNALAYLHSCINPVLYGFVGYIRSRGLRRRASFLGLFRKALIEEDTSFATEASENLNQKT